jgi:hypothetical protein
MSQSRAARIARVVGLGLGIALASTAGIARASEGSEETRNDPTAAARGQKLGIFAGAGYLGSPGTSGGAFVSGLRLRLGDHAAGSFDVGYGIVDAYQGGLTQDRWWAIPSVAVVLVPGRGRVRLDLGVGAGVGTSSGYASWSAYTAAPFTPSWHATVPAARVHAVAAFRLTPDLDAFVRADVATLVLAGSGSTHTGAGDSVWVGLWMGLQSRLL